MFCGTMRIPSKMGGCSEGEAEEEAVRGSEGKRETESEVERDRM